MEVWQQWLSAILAFGSGAVAIFITWRSEFRKNEEHKVLLREKLQRIHKVDESTAIKEAWDYARRREAYYNEDKKIREDRLKASEAMIDSLRKEIHTIRDEWMTDKTKLAIAEDRLCRCEEEDNVKKEAILRLEEKIRRYKERLGLDSDRLDQDEVQQ